MNRGFGNRVPGSGLQACMPVAPRAPVRASIGPGHRSSRMQFGPQGERGPGGLPPSGGLGERQASPESGIGEPVAQGGESEIGARGVPPRFQGGDRPLRVNEEHRLRILPPVDVVLKPHAVSKTRDRHQDPVPGCDDQVPPKNGMDVVSGEPRRRRMRSPGCNPQAVTCRFTRSNKRHAISGVVPGASSRPRGETKNSAADAAIHPSTTTGIQRRNTWKW